MQLTELRVQHPATQTYLGSPSLLRLPDGALLATHDYFGPGCPRNHEGEEHLTSVYRSDDDGESWRNLTHIASAFWSTLFVHQGHVYLLGCSQQYGSVVIRRSDDGGYTWTRAAGCCSRAAFTTTRLITTARPCRCFTTRVGSTGASRIAIRAPGAGGSRPACSRRPTTPICWTPRTGR